MSVCLGASCNLSGDLGGKRRRGEGSTWWLVRGLTFFSVEAKVTNKFQLTEGSGYRQIISSEGILERV